MLTARLTDGVWNLPHTISLLNGFLELKTKQLIALVNPTLTSTSVNLLTASPTDRPTFNTITHTQHTSPSATSTPHPNISPRISQESTTTPKPLTVDRLDALLQMQKTDPFCKHIQMSIEWQGTPP